MPVTHPTPFAVFWTAVRLATAVALLAAIVAQFVKSVTAAAELGRDVPTTIANFFSFFTILSNLSTAIVLLWAVVWFIRKGKDATAEPRSLALAIASVSTYMIVTGIVYNVLLRGVPLLPGTEVVGWSNEILHLFGPIVLLLDVLVGPRRRRLPWRDILAVVAFPLVWVVYTLVRAPLTTNPVTGDPWWYPYPFLDPHLQPWGYGGVALYIVGIAIVIAAVASFVLAIGRRRGRAGARSRPESPRTSS